MMPKAFGAQISEENKSQGEYGIMDENNNIMPSEEGSPLYEHSLSLGFHPEEWKKVQARLKKNKVSNLEETHTTHLREVSFEEEGDNERINDYQKGEVLENFQVVISIEDSEVFNRDQSFEEDQDFRFEGKKENLPSNNSYLAQKIEELGSMEMEEEEENDYQEDETQLGEINTQDNKKRSDEELQVGEQEEEARLCTEESKEEEGVFYNEEDPRLNSNKPYTLYEDWRILESLKVSNIYPYTGDEYSERKWKHLQDPLTGKRLLEGLRSYKGIMSRFSKHLKWLEHKDKKMIKQFVARHTEPQLKEHYLAIISIGDYKKFMGITKEACHNLGQFQRVASYQLTGRDERNHAQENFGREEVYTVQEDNEDDESIQLLITNQVKKKKKQSHNLRLLGMSYRQHQNNNNGYQLDESSSEELYEMEEIREGVRTRQRKENLSDVRLGNFFDIAIIIHAKKEI